MFKPMITTALLLSTHIAFAEQIPDESSACYQQCLNKRVECRKPCLAIKQDKKRYACLDACDPPFNGKCIPKCPTKEND